MRERILIVFIAVAIGLVITTLVFFLYQQTKTIPQKAPAGSAIENTPGTSPTPQVGSSYLSVDTPADQSLSDRRLIQVKGKTHPEDTIIVSTNQEDVAAKPTADGSFTVSITIDAGANMIITRSIAPSGEEVKDSRVVTFSTDDF
ncbi:MAG TPA: hypothetical protein VG965_06550 [Patescibacteria group bacterium]|nr:hypothetical protein [Patescibacteria group bacterium]